MQTVSHLEVDNTASPVFVASAEVWNNAIGSTQRPPARWASAFEISDGAAKALGGTKQRPFCPSEFVVFPTGSLQQEDV